MECPKCPECRRDLERVYLPARNLLNGEQPAEKAGDWYCSVCTGDRGGTGFRYFWESELQMPEAFDQA
jgi:hypothetical protein